MDGCPLLDINHAFHFFWKTLMSDRDDRKLSEIPTPDLVKIAFPPDWKEIDPVLEGKSNSARQKYFITICVILFIGFLWWKTNHPTVHHTLTPAEEFEINVVGDWTSIKGDETLSINLDKQRTAVVTVYKSADQSFESRGTWSAHDSVVAIEANGEAGHFLFRLGLLEGNQFNFLAPVPTDQALLVDSFIQDLWEPDPEDDYPDDRW